RRASSVPGGVPSTSCDSPVTRFVRSVAGSSFSSMPISFFCTASSGCTNTSMWPPQASPTSNATSSATPKAAIFGSPDFSTFCASSNTAPSMHPFETEPAILPERVTAIREPSGRGLEPHVSTTVASAICSFASFHARSSSRISRMFANLLIRGAATKAGQQPAQVVEGLHIVSGQEVIAVRQRCRHAARQRLVALAADERVQPDEAVRGAAQMAELGRQLSGVATIPAVADDDHDRSVSEHAARPLAIEVDERGADARATAEVVHTLGDRVEHLVDVALAQQARDAREARREDERLEVLAARHRV